MENLYTKRGNKPIYLCNIRIDKEKKILWKFEIFGINRQTVNIQNVSVLWCLPTMLQSIYKGNVFD